MATYPLFPYPPYTLALASTHDGGGRVLLAGPAACALRDSAFDLRDAGAADGAPSGRLPFMTTLHGTDITLVGQDRSYLPITRFSIDQSDAVTSISQNLKAQTEEMFTHAHSDPGDQQLRELRDVPSGCGPGARPGLAPKGRIC